MCVLMRFYAFGNSLSQDFLLKNIFLGEWETKCWTKSFSDSHIFFLIFSSACFFDIIPPMFPQALAKYF